MAAFGNANTKRYSWWWGSHISPKNSKWLQENLTDMDSKVKQMIKVIEEDADSFARRAEMYYKKRPELMKLVEEFYRAYRALAERYDHATGVIRHAQQTMAEAFPNQDPVMFGEESLLGPSTPDEFDPQTPESYPPIRAPVYPSDLQKGALGISSSHMSTVKRNIAFMEDPQSNGKGLKIGKARRGLNFNDADGINGRNAKVLSESERASKAEAEILALKDALTKVQAEKEDSLAQFDQHLERLSNMESEVSRAQEDSRCFNERATRAEAEVQTLRETLSKLEIEKESSLLQYQQCIENIAGLEERISLAQKEAGEVNERASRAEAEIITLKQSLVGSETDKEAALVRYQQCLETISNLEERLRKAEEDARLMNQRAENADGEVESLKAKVSRLTQENEAYELQYQQCLETIADLKLKLFHAQEETQRLSREIEDGVAKLKFAEEKCVVLERSNQNLHSELDGLLEKLGNQSHELTEKQKEMGKLWTTIQEEHLRFVEAETAFQTLQQLHSQSQEELNTSALELQNRSQILKDMEARNSDLLEEVQEAKNENNILNELNLTSAASVKSLHEEVSRLQETIQKLEAEVELRVDQRNALQQEIYCLKEELSQMGKKHQSILEQVELVGLHPEGFGSSIKELQEEHSKLKEIKERESIEKTALLEKLELMEKLVQKNLLLENSISDLNSELKTIRGELKTLEEACVSLAEEKSGLHFEKNMLVSRLQNATEDSKKLSEENSLLENSLSDANAELEALKSKLKSLENSCHLLNDDKSSLVNEREILLSYMDIMRKNIEDLEKEQAELNVKVLELATERESCLHKIKELGVSLDSKDRDHASFMQLSESQMNGMKSKIYHLQDENQRKEREYQDRAHDAHVEIIVLQKCLQEWLKKSSSLVAENQNLKQAGHLLEKLVSELEHENIGKQVQIDSSVNCIKVLRTGIYQVLMKLEVIPGIDSGDENSQDQKNIHEVLSRLDEMQTMLLKIQRENHQGTIENLVLVEFLRQLKSEAVGIATGKKVLEKELESERSQLLLLRDEIQKLINMNGELTTEVNQGVDREEVLTVKIEDVRRQSAIENLVLVELIKQLKSEALGITTEKSALEEELESHRDQLSFSRNEIKNLSYLIGELTTKVDQGITREEVLKVEVDDLYKQSAIENLVLVEFLKQLKSIAAGIATEKSALEEELESHGDQLSFSQNEAKNLNHMIGELTTKINQGVNREKVLKVEVDQGVDREKVLKVEIEDLHRQSAIENFVLVEFLHQLKSEAVDIATEKETLEEELESKCCQLSFSRDEAKNLSHMIEELTTKVNQRVNREEVLKVEVDDLHMQSAIKNLVLVEFLTKFKSEAVCIATEKESLEEELESQHSKLLLSLDETQKLINMIGELTTKINQGVNREEALKVENEDLHMQSAIENLVLVEFLQELKSEAVGVASEKKNLEEELESKRYQLLILRDEAKNHIYLIGDLTTKVNEGVNREEVLKVEADDLHMQSAIENLVLVEFFRSQAVGIATEKRTLEEELQSQLCLLSFSQDETKKLSHMIEELTTKVNQGVNREEVLNVTIEDLQMLSALKNLVLVEFLQQLKSEAIGIATEKQALEEELVSQRSKLSFSRDEAQKLIYMNGELTKKVNQGVDREEVLKGKNEDLQMLSAIKNLVFVEFLQQLKSEAVGIATEKENLEEELESKSYQLWISQDETKNLNYMIGELTTKVNQGVNREEVLKVEFEDLQMQSATENLVLAEFFKQFKSEAAGIAKTLEDELESLHSKLSFSRDETKKLIYLNGELTTKMNQGVSREEVLKVENEDFQMLSAIKNLVLVESLCQLKSEAVCIATEKKFLEEELESQRSKFSLSRDETQELIYMNGELTTKIKEGVSREEVLNVEIEDLHMQVLQLRNEFTILQRDNYKNLDKNSYLTNSTLRLEEEKRKLEEDISLLLSETVYQSSLFILLEDLVLEKLSEAVKLKEDLERLSFVKCKLEEEVREVGDKLRSTETENLQLEGLLEKTDAELLSARSDNDQLEHEIANVKDELVQKEKELLEAMLMISVLQSGNSELSKAVEDLECRYKETKAIEEDKDKHVLKLQEDYSEQIKKTAHANEANMKLEADLLNLLMKLEGIKAEKENLNQKLSKEKNKVELWESQASTLFGDLQVSVVHETFLKGLTHELAESYSNLENKSTLKDIEIDQLNQELSKEKNEVELWECQASTLFGDLQILVVHKTLFEGLVHELAEACNNLENRCISKDVEIDQLRGSVNNLEDAKKGQDDLMSKYAQAIILLKESIESLEKHTAMPHELEDEPTKDTASMVVDNNEGFLELQEMCLRIRAVEEALTKKLAMEELKTSDRRSRRRSGSLRKQNHEIYPQESEMITKDIVLDQVSDCSSYGISKRDILKIEEDDHVFEVQTGRTLFEESLVVDKLEISDRFTDPNKEVNKRKVLERLHSDLQKLSNLHIAVEDLKTKVERDERSEKGKEDEYETVKGQIHEAEEALEKLLSVNRKLVTKVVSGFEITDGSKSSVDLDEDERSRRRRISEQARRGSEKIGRLQFEIQRLQHLLLKLEGEREDGAKAKTSADSKTRTLLKDYIYGGVRGERRKRLKKRFAFCGCVQQPPPSP